jgi:hypothetical protein
MLGRTLKLMPQIGLQARGAQDKTLSIEDDN